MVEVSIRGTGDCVMFCALYNGLHIHRQHGCIVAVTYSYTKVAMVTHTGTFLTFKLRLKTIKIKMQISTLFTTRKVITEELCNADFGLFCIKIHTLDNQSCERQTGSTQL